jgi:hypothetical protein
MVFQPIGSYFNVSGDTAGTNVNVAIAPNGDFVTVWEEPFNGDIRDKDIFFVATMLTARRKIYL